MKERPILMSAPMVRALLAGTKTQTRRVAKGVVARHSRTGEALANIDSAGPRVTCPYGVPGDRLWVRETWGFNPDFPRQFGQICFRADPGHEHDGIKWVPSIHMPRRASRITLEITGVRVERLQDISDEDARAEGSEPRQPLMASGIVIPGQRRLGYRDLWQQINGPGSWDANPWVWVVEFKRVQP